VSSVAADHLGGIAAAPDGRTIYYGASEVQANVWLVRHSAAAEGG